MPPMSAWLELDGSPQNHVIRFHVIAPTSPARTTLSVIASGLTMPLAIVAATLNETNAPMKFMTAATRTATRGDIARVDDARRYRVRGVVEAVREVEEESDDDDRHERQVLHGMRVRRS